ncbi:MAG: hypothetical protein KJ069_27380 [Anaerolineae bacterium]|nr:hypothetical protein [Anaerolineae bacterium]
MSRPALVVGLGGTGQWVLTWLKRDLMLSNNGELPKNVKLLSIDTASQLEAGTKRVNATGKEEEGVEVGGVTLDAGEFIYIGGDSKPEAERVKRGELKPIGKWYNAQKWLDTQSPAAFILDDGAGRLRQFGRMAVFKDLLGRETGSRIWRAFRSALESVRTSTTEQRRLEIIVVGSFAGGTGSGMFLDVAQILRLMAQQRNIHHVLRGYFALPSVFTNSPDEDMRARTFAAWRELNRFMVVDSDFQMPTMEYVENESQFRIEPTQRIFDACYLVDGRRGGKPLSEEAKFGVFPMMSEVISAILDEEAGKAYTEWIYTNLAPEYTRFPDVPMYSAVGAYTVQVPAHFVQEISSYEFGQDMLLRLLQPRKKPDEFERLVASGAERHLALAAPDKNDEDKGMAGYARAPQLFTQTVSYQGNTSKPSLFMGRIASMNSQVKEGDRARAVEDTARSGGSAKSQAGWAAIYPDLGDDPSLEAIKKDVMTQMNYKPLSLARRDKESAEEARARFRSIPEDVRTRFGGIVTNDEGIDEYYGQFGEILDKVEQSHLLIFRRQMRLKLTEILMGLSENAIAARSGKLGYAWSFFNGVVDELDDFLKLMEDIRKKREELRPELKLKEQALRAEKIMQEMLGKKLLLLWESPKVKQSEDNYLRIMTRLVDVRREDVLHVYVANTARQMKAVAVEMRDAVQTWIWHLSTGDDSSGLSGLWDAIRKDKQAIQNAHGFDTKAEKVQMLIGDQRPVFEEAELAKAMSRLRWGIDYKGNPARLHLNLFVDPETDDQAAFELENPIFASSSDLRLQIGRQNQQKLMGLARRQFKGVVARTTVEQAIRETYADAARFANEIANVSAEPLFAGYSGASALKKSNLIRVQSDDPYFTGPYGVQGELRSNNNLSRETNDDKYSIQVVGSENKYKLTLVRTDDLYHYDHFTAWHECQSAYENHVKQDRRQGTYLEAELLHNFPAEARAVEYERILCERGAKYRPLHPRVVMLLEDVAAVRQFFMLAMMGKIFEVEEDNIFRWELEWKTPDGTETFWLTPGWNVDTGKPEKRPDIFSALHGYVVVGRTQEPGRSAYIEKDYAEQIIGDKTLEARQKMIEQNLAEDGFVGALKAMSYDPKVRNKVMRQDYFDLAQVAGILLQSRVEGIRAKQERESNKRRGGGLFKVYDPDNQGE